MKKFLSLLFVLMLASSTAMAAEKKSSKSKKKEEKKAEKKQSHSNGGSEKGGWVLQFQGGINLLLSSAPATFTTGGGFGAEISGAYAINQNFSIGLMTGVEVIDNKPTGSGTSSLNYAPTELVFQYNFDGSTSPFLSLGLGIANSQYTVHPTSATLNVDVYSETDFIFSPGIGLAFEVDEKTSFFVQTRIDILAPSANWKTIFNGAGIGDGVYMPFQVGVNFSSI